MTTLARILLLLVGLGIAACAAPALEPAVHAATATVPTRTELLSGEVTGGGSLAAPPEQPEASPTANATATATATPAAEARPALVVWWATDLYPADGPPLNVLEAILDGYVRGLGENALQVRVKRSEGLGSILITLQAASQVAPGAMPDLILVQRDDLLTAVQNNLIYPLNDLLPPVIRLYDPARELGTVDGILYGAAYTLEVQHFVYRSTLFERQPNTLERLLSAGQPFALSAAPLNNGVSVPLLLQYLAAGGRLLDESGRPVIDPEPLESVLAFYQAALAENLLPADLLTYDTPQDYWEDFLGGGLGLAQVDSTIYLRSRALLQNVLVEPIPTASAEAMTTLEGWLWALTTADPDRQARAVDFLDWLLRAENHKDFTQSVGMIPSQPAALQLWNDDSYSTLVEVLLNDGTVLWRGDVNPNAAAALQDAFIAVISGEQTAAEAAAEAVAVLTP